MEFVLVVLAVILAIFLGWILKQSFNTQPWVAHVVDDSAHQAPFGAGPRLVGLTTLLAVITSFFSLIISAYALRMDYGDWIPLSDPRLLWANTAMLALASVVFQWSRNAAREDNQSRVQLGLLLTGLLTFGFLIGQFVAWSNLNAAGYYMAGNPANGFFFLLTGAHALHILGGMYVWMRATLRFLRNRDAAAVRESIELCTIYWHFLLVVWLVLFGLLLST